MKSIALLKISHLLAFIPLSAGNWSLNSSNRSFISFLLFLSANLCDTLNSGEREYGVEPGSFEVGDACDRAPSSGLPDDGPGDCSALVPADWLARAREVGRERGRRARVGPDAGDAGIFSGGIVDADIRRSGGKVPGGSMARFGSYGLGLLAMFGSWGAGGGALCCDGSAGVLAGHAKVAMPAGGRPCGESPENAEGGGV